MPRKVKITDKQYLEANNWKLSIVETSKRLGIAPMTLRKNWRRLGLKARGHENRKRGKILRHYNILPVTQERIAQIAEHTGVYKGDVVDRAVELLFNV